MKLDRGGLLQSLGLKPQQEKAALAAAVKEEDEASVLGGAAMRRRLRHVSQLAIRGFNLCGEAEAGGYILEVAAVGAADPLEQSDVLRTRDPTWAPVCGIRRGRHLHSFEFRAVHPGSREVFWKEIVNLSEVELFCEDLEELHRLPPLSAPLVQLGNRWFTLPGTTCPATSKRQPESRRRSALVKHLRVSEVCNAGGQISTMIDRLQNLRAQSKTLREAMEESLSDDNKLSERQEQRFQCEESVKQLRLKVEMRKKDVMLLRSQLGDMQKRRGDNSESRARVGASLREARIERETAALDLLAANDDSQVLWQQLRCRQMRMLHEACQVYPIADCGRYWTIRGLSIAVMETLLRQDLREEENFSTALGFLVHLLVTLASILEVPLRVTVQQAGCSRSFLGDPHESADAPPRELPLFYGRGLEKSRFEAALRLLQDALHQFLYSRGYFDERRISNSSFLECVELILQKEIYGVEPLS